MQIGELVRLKSGGPVMTVAWVENGKIGCNWFNQDDELKSAYFAEDQLRIATDEAF